MGLPLNDDGTCRPFTPAEVVAMGIEIIGIRNGESPIHSRALNASTVQVKYRVLSAAFNSGDFLAYMLGGAAITGDNRISRLSRKSIVDGDCGAAEHIRQEVARIERGGQNAVLHLHRGCVQ